MPPSLPTSTSLHGGWLYAGLLVSSLGVCPEPSQAAQVTGRATAPARAPGHADSAPAHASARLPRHAPGHAAPTLLAAIPAPGARLSQDGLALEVAVYSSRATRLEVWFYAEALNAPAAVRYLLTKDAASSLWWARIPLDELEGRYGVDAPYYYGLRAWGPNWPYADRWTPGSSEGFLADVDAQGNRFDPNKLLLDPYALEVSHDPQTPEMSDATLYATGPAYRALDSGPWAPKGLVLEADAVSVGTRPIRALKDEIVYEVHLRGLTMNDPSVSSSCRGTYAGAAQKAASLKALGVTAVSCCLSRRRRTTPTTWWPVRRGTTTGAT